LASLGGSEEVEGCSPVGAQESDASNATAGIADATNLNAE
jgi:hypothetical protein